MDLCGCWYLNGGLFNLEAYVVVYTSIIILLEV